MYHQFIQPLNFATFIDNGERVFEVVDQWFPGLVDYYHSSLGINITQYAGARLIQIDQQDPLSYFEAFAKTQVSTSKDVQTRFNLVFYMPDIFDASANLG